ncbi:UNVERIFIED_CONTAM: Sec-independent protein translocase protein TATB, chloroplastic [Sesamum calycinum]|uniref:Sec-independent protein translocase protein TATB, chloroplastic n=1 Tax=Sesamum calycinum TaxID=2727403 RepID=A0AAW2RSJ6_9LAMI
MAFAISTPTLHSSSSYPGGIPSLFVSVPKYALGLAPFSQWSGLKQLGISTTKSSAKMGGKRKCKGRGVYASLFGVGAPEALVIGVVALLVFGPKGLAEEVSREFKSSLEREIGLDEINNQIPRTFSSDIPRTAPLDNSEDSGTNIESKESPEDNGSPSESGAYTANEYLKVTQAQFEGALAQLRKEQEEEEKRTALCLNLNLPLRVSEHIPAISLSVSLSLLSFFLIHLLMVLGTSEEPSSVIAPSQNPDIDALQESASVLPPGPSPEP